MDAERSFPEENTGPFVYIMMNEYASLTDLSLFLLSPATEGQCVCFSQLFFQLGLPERSRGGGCPLGSAAVTVLMQ